MTVPVTLHYSDPLMHRLALEHQRLTRLCTTIADQIADHETQLLAGLTSRNITRLDLPDGLHLRRNGRAGVTITTPPVTSPPTTTPGPWPAPRTRPRQPHTRP